MIPITVHCIVKNEERWIWYALSSVIDISSKILIYDTGSTDRTVEIIKNFKNPKIALEEKDKVDAQGLVDLRKEQLEKTKTDWFLILDGDEIWPNATKAELIKKLNKASIDDWGVVIRAWNLIGDIYHFHPESIHYHWPFAPKNYLGWANLRVLNTHIPGLNIKGKYPLEAYCDKSDTPVQNHGKKHLMFLDERYFHVTYLPRSSNLDTDKKTLNRSHKKKYELGYNFPIDFKYPEVLKQDRPKNIQNPWIKRSLGETVISAIQTPIKELRRRSLRLYYPKI